MVLNEEHTTKKDEARPSRVTKKDEARNSKVTKKDEARTSKVIKVSKKDEGGHKNKLKSVSKKDNSGQANKQRHQKKELFRKNKHHQGKGLQLKKNDRKMYNIYIDEEKFNVLEVEFKEVLGWGTRCACEGWMGLPKSAKLHNRL